MKSSQSVPATVPSGRSPSGRAERSVRKLTVFELLIGMSNEPVGDSNQRSLLDAVAVNATVPTLRKLAAPVGLIAASALSSIGFCSGWAAGPPRPLPAPVTRRVM